jgi:hypothetical protein
VSGKRVSIALAMRLTVIVALNLAMLRAVPDMSFFLIPPIFFGIVLLDLALVLPVVFGRPLGTFYFTFLIVGVLSTSVITVLAAMLSSAPPLSLHILETAIQHLRAARGQSRVVSLYDEFPMLVAAELWLTCILSVLPAWAAATLASWWLRRRRRRTSKWGQTVVAFLQGALIGLGFFVLGFWVVLYLVLARSDSALPRDLQYISLASLIACPLAGGLALASLTHRRVGEHQRETPQLP